MGAKKSSKESKLSKYIKAPMKILGRAMSLYIKSSETVSFGATPIGCPTGAMVRSNSVGAMARSNSVGSSTSTTVSFGATPIGCPTRAMVRSNSVGAMARSNSVRSSTSTTTRAGKCGGIEYYRAEPGLSRSASAGSVNSSGIVMIKARKIEGGTDVSPRKQGLDEGKLPTKVPRSKTSVGIGRIEEDKSCRFDIDFKGKTPLLSRTKSYAVSKKNYWIF